MLAMYDLYARDILCEVGSFMFYMTLYKLPFGLCRRIDVVFVIQSICSSRTAGMMTNGGRGLLPPANTTVQQMREPLYYHTQWVQFYQSLPLTWVLKQSLEL